VFTLTCEHNVYITACFKRIRNCLLLGVLYEVKKNVSYGYHLFPSVRLWRINDENVCWILMKCGLRVVLKFAEQAWVFWISACWQSYFTLERKLICASTLYISWPCEVGENLCRECVCFCKRNYVVSCTVKPYGILTIKNALIRTLYTSWSTPFAVLFFSVRHYIFTSSSYYTALGNWIN
jgi:hypothetical protein